MRTTALFRVQSGFVVASRLWNRILIVGISLASSATLSLAAVDDQVVTDCENQVGRIVIGFKSNAQSSEPTEENQGKSGLSKDEQEKAEYIAWIELELAKRFLEESKRFDALGKDGDAYRHLCIGKDRLRAIAKQYPTSLAALDAHQILKGKTPKYRPQPSFPVAMAAHYKPLENARSFSSPSGSSRTQLSSQVTPTNSLFQDSGFSSAAMSGKTVYVHSYVRSNGTPVAGHFRGAPHGGGGGRR
jgi:hypothetical protein